MDSADSGAKDASLPPTNELDADTFESYTEAVLSAHRFALGPGRHVVRVSRWGRRGDKQDGIDLDGEWSDGARATWQCKAYERLQPAHVHNAVEVCTRDADEHYLVYSGIASAPVRDAIKQHPTWQVVDRRDLKQLLDDAPIHRRREILDTFWDRTTRKRLLQMPGADAFETIGALAKTRLELPVLNDRGPIVGRAGELQELQQSLEANVRILVVTGPGGMGKSRLAVTALNAYQERNSGVAVLSLLSAASLSDNAFDELPHAPAVLFIDDAHERPEAVAQLLQYAVRNAGTRLLITMRRAGSAAIWDALVRAGISATDVLSLELQPLTSTAAMELVEALATEMDFELLYGAKLAIAKLAEEAPYLGVLALDALRRRTLSGSFALNNELRSAVLASYRRSVVDAVGQASPETVQRLLATCAAIGGSIDIEDEELISRVAKFCGLTSSDAMALIASLVDADIFVRREGRATITPDLLGDLVLESLSVHESLGQKTDFVPSAWTQFYPHAGMRLLRRIADLDWRLRRRGLPGVVDDILPTLHAEVETADVIGLHEAVQRLGYLSSTQPQAVMALISGIRTRLEHLRQYSVEEPSSRGPLTATHFEQRVRDEYGLQRISSHDVAIELAPLIAQSARSDVDLLETALDYLCDLHRQLALSAAWHDDAALTAIKGLLDLGRLPSHTVPIRVIRRVGEWLADGKNTIDEFMLSPLKPLLVKQGESHRQAGERTLALNTYLVDSEWAHPVRSAIRELLLACGTAENVSVAAKAVRLLQDALQPPRSMYTYVPEPEDITKWESDDFATIEALRQIAEGTSSSVIRRIVRESVAWTAQHGTSKPLRDAAFDLVVWLDNCGDELADILLGSHELGLRNQFGRTAPSGETAAALDSDEPQREIDDSYFEGRQRERLAVLSRWFTSLGPEVESATLINAIEAVACDICASRKEGPTFFVIGRYFVEHHQHRCAELLLLVSERAPGPIDNLLRYLIAGWAQCDEPQFLTWLSLLHTRRTAVRAAAAEAFTPEWWAKGGEELREIHREGCADPDREVRARFHLAAQALLAEEPVATVKLLLETDIETTSATELINGATRYGRAGWLNTLGATDARIFLRLMERSNLDDYGIDSALAAISRNHPRIILDFLLQTVERHSSVAERGDALSAAFSEAPQEIVDWLAEKLDADPYAVGAVLSHATHGHVTTPLTAAMATLSRQLDARLLPNLVTVLESMSLWPLRMPTLAEAIIARVEDLAGEQPEWLLPRLGRAGTPRVVGWINGESEELREALRLVTALQRTPGLREELVVLAADWNAQLTAEINALKERYESGDE